MTDKDYLHGLRTPSEENPLRIMISACLIGDLCGVDGTSNGVYPSALQLMKYKTVKLIPFCPEHYAFGTPRETPDCAGGSGHDVLNGLAKVVSQTDKDMTVGMVDGALKMLQIAQDNDVELAFLMDVSGACGSQVIYNGSRFNDTPKYQIGMGVCAAHLDNNGIKVISQRDYASIEILLSKLDSKHVIDKTAIDHDQTEWYKSYFGKNDFS